MSNAADYDMKKEAQTLRRTICNQSPYHWTLSLGLLMPTLYHAKQDVYIRRSLKQLIRHKGCTARSSDLRKEHSHDGTPRTTATSPRLGRGGCTNSRVEQGIVPLRNSAAEESGLQPKNRA